MKQKFYLNLFPTLSTSVSKYLKKINEIKRYKDNLRDINKMDRLPADVLMLINKFAWGSPTAKLIKQAPKWKLDLRMITYYGEHFSNYETDEQYWQDFELEHTKWTTDYLEDDSISDEEYRRRDEWHTRYLNTYFA